MKSAYTLSPLDLTLWDYIGYAVVVVVVVVTISNLKNPFFVTLTIGEINYLSKTSQGV